MANPSKFTLEAINDVRRQLRKKNYRVAMLVASLYLQTRLGTLLTRSLEIRKRNRRKFNRLFADLTLGRLVSLAHKARMITSAERDSLNKFVELRNDIAHELEMWDPLSDDLKRAAEHWCNFALQFMSDTDERVTVVRPRGPRQPPSYLTY